MWIHLLVVAVGALVPSTSAADKDGHLVLIDEARCLDGSRSGYYFRPALSTAASRNFVFSLEGGGECVGEQDCSDRAKTDLGSSLQWPQSTPLWDLQDINCTFNPDFCEWNQVFIKYCSGDLFSGRRSKPSPESFNLTFEGHNIVAAVITHLKKTQSLDKADTVVFSGESAGGIGVFINLDYVASCLPSTRTVGAPIAGFYFPTYMYTGKGSVPGGIPFTPDAWPKYVQLWDAFVPEACAAREERWKCMMANYTWETLKTPVYIMEAQTDRVQMQLHDWVPCTPKPTSPDVLAFIADWGRNMTAALHTAVTTRPDFALFSPACYMHTEFGAEQPIVGGFNIYQGLGAWVHGRGGVPRVLVDDCGVMCNPTCPP